MIVEDNPDNLEIYATALRHDGYEVLEATTGEQALELAGDRRLDAVVLDMAIPGVDGWTVAERLKTGEETRDLPIIAVTAHALPEDRERAMRVGCDTYLSKPVRPRRVREEVDRFVRASSGGSPAAEG